MPRQFDEANAWDRFLRRFAATGPGFPPVPSAATADGIAMQPRPASIAR